VTAIPLPSIRRRAGRLPRVDARLAVGLLLMAVSVGGGLRLAGAADRTVPVVAATHDLAAGHVLARADLEIARVHGGRLFLATLVRGADRPLLVGQVLLAPVARHGPVARAALATAPRAGREITVPIAPEHALAGAVRVGERVDVLATFDKAGPGARTVTVVRGAEVVAVSRSHGLFGQGGPQVSAITLSVAPDDAVFLAFALRTGELDIIRSTGGPPAARDTFERSSLDPAGDGGTR
jgi:Flp pilus assembly protein CpaB